MPITRCGCGTQAAMVVSEIDEVLLARMVSGPTMPASSRKICSLMAAFSVAASITSWQSASAARPVRPWMRARTSLAPASVCAPFFTSRARLLPMLARPRATAASLTSAITTLKPAWAKTWAMPLPMVPTPITPICLNSIAVLLVGVL
ncbi:hypothetical protein D3C85_1231480 [compost metagenome]